LESPSSSECEEERRFEVGIGVAIWCVNDIQESIQRMLEHLRRNILNKRSKVTLGPSAT
jgi:hypothetical protein